MCGKILRNVFLTYPTRLWKFSERLWSFSELCGLLLKVSGSFWNHVYKGQTKISSKVSLLMNTPILKKDLRARFSMSADRS